MYDEGMVIQLMHNYKVRVVKSGTSVEFCGGCHAKNTKDLVKFKIAFVYIKF